LFLEVAFGARQAEAKSDYAACSHHDAKHDRVPSGIDERQDDGDTEGKPHVPDLKDTCDEPRVVSA
jgi:hypothetical protein